MVIGQGGRQSEVLPNWNILKAAGQEKEVSFRVGGEEWKKRARREGGIKPEEGRVRWEEKKRNRLSAKASFVFFFKET